MEIHPDVGRPVLVIAAQIAFVNVPGDSLLSIEMVKVVEVGVAIPAVNTVAVLT